MNSNAEAIIKYFPVQLGSVCVRLGDITKVSSVSGRTKVDLDSVTSYLIDAPFDKVKMQWMEAYTTAVKLISAANAGNIAQ